MSARDHWTAMHSHAFCALIQVITVYLIFISHYLLTLNTNADDSKRTWWLNATVVDLIFMCVPWLLSLPQIVNCLSKKLPLTNQSCNRGRGLFMDLINIHVTKCLRSDSGRYGIAYVSGRERLDGLCSSVLDARWFDGRWVWSLACVKNGLSSV